MKHVVQQLPDPIRAAAHEPYSALALVCALLLDPSQKVRRAQHQKLEEEMDLETYWELCRLEPLVGTVADYARIPLIDMAIPALRELSPAQYGQFKQNVVELIRADDKIDLFEWVLRRIILQHLEPVFARVKPPAVRYRSLHAVRQQGERLLSALAYAGHTDRQSAEQAFASAAACLDGAVIAMAPVEEFRLDKVGQALDALAKLAPFANR